MIRKSARLSREEAMAVAERYTRLKDFYTCEPEVYWESIYNGWASDYTWLERVRAKPCTWDDAYAKGIASMSSADFREKDGQAYAYAYKNCMLCCMPWATDYEVRRALKRAISMAWRCRDMEGFRKSYKGIYRSLAKSDRIACVEAHFANRSQASASGILGDPAPAGTERMVPADSECQLECLIDLRWGDHAVQVAADDPALCRACADALKLSMSLADVFVDCIAK